MADLTVTVASVQSPGANGTVNTAYNAGTTITAGQSVYLAANSTWLLAQADGTTIEAGSSSFGIAMHGSLSGQPLAVQTAGYITIGATVVVGKLYVISATAGGVCPIADITTTGHYVTIIGIGRSSSIIDTTDVKKYTGITIP